MASLHAARVFASLRGQAPRSPRPEVVTSWERYVEEYHLEPHHVARPQVLSGSELKEAREPVHELIHAARSEIDRLFRRLAEDGYIILLTEANGVSVDCRMPDTLRTDARHARLMPGSIWTENHQGTNGVGTCLRTRQPVSIVEDEHFAVHNAGLTCTVAPIHAPDGTLIAVLDVSTPKPATHAQQRLVLDIVRNSARRIENRMFRSLHRGLDMLCLSRDPHFADSAEECMVALDEAGIVVAADQVAAALLTPLRGGDPLGRPISRLLRRKQDLRPAAAGSAPIELGRLGSERTRLFARLVPVEPRPTARPASPAARRKEPPPAMPPSLAVLAGGDEHAGRLVRTATRVHAAGLPLLLTGETGTGKGALAAALHQAGPRAAFPFVTVNCAAMPAGLIESELFGYRPGAFTGAAAAGATGRLLAAQHGTLFLDEIGDMPLEMQTRLLRVLSEGEIEPLNGPTVRLDVSVIAATHQDLRRLVGEQRFRGDLYHRLAGAILELPPLKARADRDRCIAHALAEAALAHGLRSDPEPSLLAELAAYAWPGNFRELHHVARFAAAMSDGEPLSQRHLPAHLQGVGEPLREGDPLASALATTDWNVSAAARSLGISRATVHRRIRAHGLHRPG